MKKFKKEENNSWFCDGILPDGKVCNAYLGKMLDENKAIITAINGQEYEVCFAYIDLICKRCGKKHLILSSIFKDMFDLASVLYLKGTKRAIRYKDAFVLDVIKSTPGLLKLMQPQKSILKLDAVNRKNLLNRLTDSQKNIYKILSEKRGKGAKLSDAEKILNELKKKTTLGEQKIYYDMIIIVNIINSILNNKKT